MSAGGMSRSLWTCLGNGEPSLSPRIITVPGWHLLLGDSWLSPVLVKLLFDSESEVLVSPWSLLRPAGCPNQAVDTGGVCKFLELLERLPGPGPGEAGDEGGTVPSPGECPATGKSP